MHKYLPAILICLLTLGAQAQFTRQDTLRGSIGDGRSWWDVDRYDLHVEPLIHHKQIDGRIGITFTVVNTDQTGRMQIDMQAPMQIFGATMDNVPGPLTYTREGNVYWINTDKIRFEKNKKYTLRLDFDGAPRAAVNPPWDGGWIWKTDKQGRPWISVACQGLGASAWFPCKDHQSDEPDHGATIAITTPAELTGVANGRMIRKQDGSDGKTTWYWEVKNPINNYTIIPYIGKYVHFREDYQGKAGVLNCDYWVLDYDLETAKRQFGRDVKLMLASFEDWFGPYPFYKDGYKLVQAPHLGMEHQSAIAYGNDFKNGYGGHDLSGSGWGSKWDYIIIHESGHEWFGNNITTKDIADMWVHEAFTMYSEVLFVESQYGKKAADEYCIGVRSSIANDKPIVGKYGVNNRGSGDMYYKGANMIHSIRQVMNDDKKFKEMLQGLNKTFYHQTVTGQQVEKYMSDFTGKDLSKIFDQYLRTTQVPQLEIKHSKKNVEYRWINVVNGFDMPVNIIADGKTESITPSEKWQKLPITGEKPQKIEADKRFYFTITNRE